MEQEYLENDIRDDQISELREMENTEDLLLNSSNENDDAPVEPFKIDENMPEELKQQLEKFNSKVNNLNVIRNEDVSSDNLDVDEEDIGDDNISENDEIIEDDISADDIGNLF